MKITKAYLNQLRKANAARVLPANKKLVSNLRKGDTVLIDGQYPIRALTDAQPCAARGYYKVECERMEGCPSFVDVVINTFGGNEVTVRN